MVFLEEEINKLVGVERGNTWGEWEKEGVITEGLCSKGGVTCT